MTVQKLDPDELAKFPKHFVVVRKRLLARRALTVWERRGRECRPVFKCRVAIGTPAHPTRSGPYFITRKEMPATFTAPNVQWALDAGYKPGQKIPAGDPVNPLRGAFLWLGATGIGIHGTPALWSLGTRASHGCIRVSEENAVELFRTVELGTPVYVG